MPSISFVSSTYDFDFRVDLFLDCLLAKAEKFNLHDNLSGWVRDRCIHFSRVFFTENTLENESECNEIQLEFELSIFSFRAAIMSAEIHMYTEKAQSDGKSDSVDSKMVRRY